jgi:chromosome segregation ATPase
MVTFAIHSPPRPADADDEQLLKLFWNRAELKKEFAELRRDRDRLKDKIRQQEDKNLKVQQSLERLEGMLSDPLQSANASVFYQLRGVWQNCWRRLGRIATDLSAHQVDREKSRILHRFEAGIQAEADVLGERLSAARMRLTGIEREFNGAQERVRRLRGFWNYLKRRNLRSQLVVLDADRRIAEGQTESLKADLADLKRRVPPGFEGLSREGKRKVNIAIIALAQELFLYFTAHDIGVMARDAVVRQVAEVNYGDIRTCRRSSREIQNVFHELNGVDDFPARVQHRSKYLAAQATYRRDDDTVPVAGSFHAIPLEISPAGDALGDKALGTNVLADEYWDIYKVLLT